MSNTVIFVTFSDDFAWCHFYTEMHKSDIVLGADTDVYHPSTVLMHGIGYVKAINSSSPFENTISKQRLTRLTATERRNEHKLVAK